MVELQMSPQSPPNKFKMTVVTVDNMQSDVCKER